MASKRWSGEDMVKAIDVYLAGSGLVKAASAVGRSVRATANLLLSDLPRNYRGCVGWLPDDSSLKSRREDDPVSQIERKYLLLLYNRKMSLNNIGLIMGRTQFTLGQIMADIRPKQTSPGFGFDGEVK